MIGALGRIVIVIALTMFIGGGFLMAVYLTISKIDDARLLAWGSVARRSGLLLLLCSYALACAIAIRIMFWIVGH
jgi:hypothetical protein